MERGGRYINWKRGCEMKRREKKGGFYIGRGASERSWPINGLKCLFNGWFRKLMVGAGNEGFAADGRWKGQGDEQCNLRNSTGCENFATWKISKQKNNTPSPLCSLQNRKPKIMRRQTCK